MDQMMFRDPDAPPVPNEAWAGQMQAHEIALFCVNFKSRTPVREETGRPGPRSEETCRIFQNLEEAESYARVVVEAHPSIVCILRSKDDRDVKDVSNRRFMHRFAFASLLTMGVWLTLAGGLGLAIILLVRLLVRADGPQWLLMLSVRQWFGVVTGAVVLGSAALVLKMYLSATRKAANLVQAINSSLSPEEKGRYKDLNALAASSDPEDRRRASRLSRQYQERIMQIRREMR